MPEDDRASTTGQRIINRIEELGNVAEKDKVKDDRQNVRGFNLFYIELKMSAYEPKRTFIIYDHTFLFDDATIITYINGNASRKAPTKFPTKNIYRTPPTK